MAATRAVDWSDRALEDVENAYEYFLERSPDYAARFLSAIERAADSLAELSERGRVVPELEASQLRELIIEKHRLVYRVDSTRVVIARLIHGAQDLKSSWRSLP